MYNLLLVIYIILVLLAITNLTEYDRLIYFISTIIFATIGFFFNPIKAFAMGNYLDSYRIFLELDLYREWGWNAGKTLLYQSYNYLGNYDDLPLIKCYWYVVSRFNNNGWLAFINTFLIFTMTYLSINRLAKKLEISGIHKQISATFIFFIVIEDFSRTIANIRMPLAIAVFILALAYDVTNDDKKNKIIYWLGYFSTMLLHNSMFMFVIIRVLASLYKNINYRKLVLFIFLVFPIISSGVISIFSKYLSITTVDKINYTMDKGLGGLSGILTLRYGTIIIIIRILISLIMIYELRRINIDSQNSSLGLLVFFSEIVIAFSISSTFLSWNLTNRLSLVLVNLLPLLIIVRKYLANDRKSIFYLNRQGILVWIMTITSMIYYFGTYVYQVLIF